MVPVQESTPSDTVTLPVGAVGEFPKAPVGPPYVTVNGWPVTVVASPWPGAPIVVDAWLTVICATLNRTGAVPSASTFAAALAAPAPVAVKVAVAVPAGWIVVCAPEIEPRTALHATGRPRR